ncbi:MAG: class I SAM-dependent methyltransferase [Burkholderiales bacterium]
MAAQQAAILGDIVRLLSRKAEFVEVPCPACGSPEAFPRFGKRGFNYVECRGCRTMYMTPRPSPSVLEWLYRESENYAYWNKVIFPASEAARREKIFVPRVDRTLELCGKYGAGRGALLEIGAGFGTFCSELKARNAFDRIVAVEPTPDLAATCRRRGIEVIEQPVDRIDPAALGRFDVIASFEVIEHLFAPGTFVDDAARLLAPKGLLILTCPNGRGFDIETLGPLSSAVDHEHLNYFNPGSLGLLLGEHGLEVLECFTPGRLDAELVRNQAIAGAIDLSAQAFLRRVLIDDWDEIGEAFQDFLVQQGLSSNMWIVAGSPRPS